MGCTSVSDPKNSFRFAKGSIEGIWSVDASIGLSIRINNANANLSGSLSGDNYNASGSGNVAGFNTGINISGMMQWMPGGFLRGNVTTGPLSTPDDIVIMFCQGHYKF